ncbi:SHOCT domain-containing protein [Tellurirhabdus bombi]|uniref:SHOCT domain-containing protein n=1 Tax=Tellurirhabdus bombi TaxID=2907205 RepID=UPI001F480A1E|nr:SHOCT domain-containing protein [Tellurirhabdus bombi]
MAIFFSWIVFAFVAAAIGSSRKIGGIATFFISIFFSPIVGIIVALASKRKDQEKFEQELLKTQRRNEYGSEYLGKSNELYRLKDLLDKGVITEDEFQDQKRKLLGE